MKIDPIFFFFLVERNKSTGKDPTFKLLFSGFASKKHRLNNLISILQNYPQLCEMYLQNCACLGHDKIIFIFRGLIKYLAHNHPHKNHRKPQNVNFFFFFFRMQNFALFVLSQDNLRFQEVQGLRTMEKTLGVKIRQFCNTENTILLFVSFLQSIIADNGILIFIVP